MKLGQVIARFGKEMRAEGIAIYAYVEANPDATCAEACEAIGMCDTTLIKHARNLERLGLLVRTVEKSPNGLCLPAKLLVQDPLKNSGGTSDKTPSEIATPLEVTPPQILDPSNFSGVDSKGVSLSDPLKNSGGTSGTPIAPSKAIRTSTEESQATPETAASPAAVVDWGEIGRERQKMLDALKAALRVGVLSAPQAERATCNWLLKNRDKLNATTEDFIECMREQAEEVESGSGRRKVSWMTVKGEFSAWQLRARGGVKNVERNQPRRQAGGTRADTYRAYDYSGFDGVPGEGAGRPDREVPPDEWVATSSTQRPDGDDGRLAGSPRHLRRTG